MITAGAHVWVIPGACSKDESRPTRTREGVALTTGSTNAERTDDGEWSAEEDRVLLDAVKPGEPFRHLGVYANMRDDCRKQLDHVKKRVGPGIACMATWDQVDFADVLLVSNAAVLKQATYGLQFTNISEAEITDLMGKSRTVALHAAHVASTEPRGLTCAPGDLHGPGLTNWHTANTANKIVILHQMLNGRDKGLAEMAQNELWEASQQTGAMGMMA